jgi:aminoimidazole riboside kinase
MTAHTPSLCRPVVLLGDINVDLVVRLPNRKTGIGYLEGSEPQLYGGGTVANTAVGLTRLGVPARIAGSVGTDSYGRWAVKDLGSEGVDVSGILNAPDQFTVMVFAMVDSTGERTIVVWPPEGGAHTVIQPKDLDPEMIHHAGWFHTSGMCFRSSPVRGTILSTMLKARSRNIPVSVDLNLRLELWGWKHGVREVAVRAIAAADVVFAAGEEELIPLTGKKTVEDAAAEVASWHPAAFPETPQSRVDTPIHSAAQPFHRVVVARAGQRGTLVLDADGIHHVPAFAADVRDTLGAGDAFNAGFIAARMEGLSNTEAARWGSAAGAFSVSGSGARHLPSRQELESILRSDNRLP